VGAVLEMAGTHKRTTTARGLNYRHRQAVAELKRNHVDGSECYWCSEPLLLSQGLHADHVTPRSAGNTGPPTRLLHSWCNAARQDGRNDDQRPAVTGRPMSRDLHQAADVGHRVMLWPW